VRALGSPRSRVEPDEFADRLVEGCRRGEVRHACPHVVDVPRRADTAVDHGFHAVSIRVEQEGAVVVVAALRARPGCAVVAVAGVDTGTPEALYLVAG
jgi:hypothetical protein